jgi:hypothetical protein
LKEETVKKLFLGLAALPFLAGLAVAAEPLSDPQMDRVSAGATCLPNFTCTTSMSGNTTTNFGCLSGPNGCNGQVFMPTTPQTFFNDLNSFLKGVGFNSSCSTASC